MMDVYKVTIIDVENTAKKYGYNLHRRVNYYFIVCDEITGGNEKSFPDNPHGYTEAIAYLDALCNQEEVR